MYEINVRATLTRFYAKRSGNNGQILAPRFKRVAPIDTYKSATTERSLSFENWGPVFVVFTVIVVLQLSPPENKVANGRRKEIFRPRKWMNNNNL